MSAMSCAWVAPGMANYLEIYVGQGKKVHSKGAKHPYANNAAMGLRSYMQRALIGCERGAVSRQREAEYEPRGEPRKPRKPGESNQDVNSGVHRGNTGEL